MKINLDRYTERQLDAIVAGGTRRDGSYTPIAMEAFALLGLRAEAEFEAGVVYCSICDGTGHGQPGYGPCPVFEDRPSYDRYDRDERAWF